MTDLAEALKLVEQPDGNGRNATGAEQALVMALVELVNVNRTQLMYMQKINARLEPKAKRSWNVFRRRPRDTE